MKKLSPALEAELKYLRRQVDNLQDEEHRRDARPTAKQELWTARGELNRFVSKLRTEGINI